MGVDSVSGPNCFALVSPSYFGLASVCLQSAVCCEGEAGISLGSDTVAADRYCSSKQKAKLE